MSDARPNILIFHCDQLRYDALGCTGHPGNPTPNIDALAAKGLSFTRHFTANPVCMPSRASFFTGMPVTAHGVWSNGVPLNRREYLPFGHFKNDPTIGSIPELPTFADLLSQGGYATGAFGKLHLTPSVEVTGYEFPESDRRWASGEQDDWHGPYYGFQHVDLTHAHGECPGGHYEAWLRDTHPELYEEVRRNQRKAERPIEELGDLHASVLTYDTHPSPWIARRTLEWIHDQGNQPFCAFLGFPDPHHAFCALDEDIDYFDGVEMVPPIDADGSARPDMDGCGMDVRHFTPEQHDLVRRTTAAMVRTIDRAVGEVIEGIKAEGKWENTVVLFTSDHGDYLGDHGRLRKSQRAAEQLLHVPCILRLPGEPELNVPRLNTATSNTDILPTLLQLAGIEVPEHVQGSGLLANMDSPTHALAHGFDATPKGANFSIMDERYRYTLYPHTGYKELFDHVNDRLECHNLADDPECAAALARLHAALGDAQLRAVNPTSGRLSSW
jgi:arylsulfatase A-like enzyme